MELLKNGLLLICNIKRKEILKKFESYPKFNTCFDGIPDLEELK